MDVSKEKIDNYKRLSNLYFTGILTSIGGIGALLLLPLSLKTNGLLIICIYFLCISILRHQNYNEKISSLIKDNEG